MANDGDDWYEPLMDLRSGDHLRVIALVGRNVRHFAVRASGAPSTEEGYDGAFLNAAYVDIVEGAGGAQLSKGLTGPRGPGLLHICDVDRDSCKVYSPDEGRILFHVDQYRLRPDLGGPTPVASERRAPMMADPGAGAPLLDEAGAGSEAGDGARRPDLAKRFGELKESLRRGAPGGREAAGPSDAPSLGSVLADRAREHRKKVSEAPPGDHVRERGASRPLALVPSRTRAVTARGSRVFEWVLLGRARTSLLSLAGAF